MSQQPPQQSQSEYEAMNETSGRMQSGAGGSRMTGTESEMQPGMQSEMQPGMQSGTQQTGTGMRGQSTQTGRMKTGMHDRPGQPGRMQGRDMHGQAGGMQGRDTQQPQAGERRSFEDHLTNELRIALEDFTEVSHVAGWCAKECAGMGPQMRTCARVCQDIAEIAELNEKMIARDSMFGQELAETFVRVAIEGLPEIRQHSQQHPQIAETVATIERTMNSCRTVLGTVGQQGGGQGRTNGTQGMGQRNDMQRTTQPSTVQQRDQPEQMGRMSQQRM